MPPEREPAAIVIGELEPPPPQLASKDPILFHQIGDRLPLLATQPAGQDGQHHLESGRVDHGWSLYHGAKLAPPTPSAELWDSSRFLFYSRRASDVTRLA
jgi:hypothetical protein